MTFSDYLNLAQILVAIVLSVIILLQAKGSDIGTALGGGTSGRSRGNDRSHSQQPGNQAVVLWQTE